MAEDLTNKRLSNIDKDLHSNIYGAKEDIPNDTRSGKIEESLKTIKDRANNGKSNSVLDTITDVVMNQSKAKGSRAVEHSETKGAFFDQISNALNTETMQGDFVRNARYDDYRLIDEYISQVGTSLDILTDSIMSPDDISKKSATSFYDGSTEDETTQSVFESNMKDLYEKYNLESFFHDSIRNGLMLGDDFTIVNSLSNEFSKVLNEEHEAIQDLDEYEIIDEGVTLVSNNLFTDKVSKILTEMADHLITDDKDKETFIKNSKTEMMDAINKNVIFTKNPMDLISEASRLGNNSGLTSKQQIDITGSYFKSIKPEDIIKLEVDHVCVGYIFIDRTVDLNNNVQASSGASMLGSLTSVMNTDGTSASSNLQADKFATNKKETENGNTLFEYDALVDILVNGISKKVDKRFLEKNSEFRDIIFSLVKKDYIINKGIGVTYIEAESVHHMKLDSTETYGISRLKKSLFPSKLYLFSLITSLMVKINQGKDTRIFYVETGIDSDIEGSVQTMIRDIKSKEVPTDMLGNSKSLSTALNTVGALDNYYVPTTNGERTFDIDTISGIQSDIDDSNLENLIRAAVIGTGVPYNYIDASNDVDFARSLAMQNQGFVKKVVSYQETFGRYFTKIVRDLYTYEFGIDKIPTKKPVKKNSSDDKEEATDSIVSERSTSIEVDLINVRFPAPISLSISTINEQIEASNVTIDYITGLYLDEDTEEVNKRLFKQRLAREIYNQNLDWKKLDGIFEKYNEDLTKDKIEKDLLPNENKEEESL